MQKSPLAPTSFPAIPPIAGVELSTISAAIKYQDRDDMLLAKFSDQTTAAGVFTQSLTASAPVHVCRRNLEHEIARGLLVNSGNSNAFTGRTGQKDCQTALKKVAEVLGCETTEVFLASTGVIGEPLPIDRMMSKVAALGANLNAYSWPESAQAIMTTDTFPKAATRKFSMGGTEVTINGIAKGSGMIAPDMATMLAFCFTDAAIEKSLLQAMLEQANKTTFNAITVDSDTSTSDTLMLFATGVAGNPEPQRLDDPMLDEFKQSLEELLRDLAHQVVRDGEGASKFIQVRVTGAATDDAARIIANSIANSPLVKTAIAGEDANWGRVVMAVGKSGQKADRDKLEIRMGGILITQNGEVVQDYDEKLVASHLKKKDIDIDVDVGIGHGDFTIWTCDLTHGYISINADYRS